MSIVGRIAVHEDPCLRWEATNVYIGSHSRLSWARRFIYN
jgi:hypothetical protein